MPGGVVHVSRKAAFKVELVGFRDLYGRFVAAIPEAKAYQRGMVRNVMERVKIAAEDASPMSEQEDVRHRVHFAHSWKVGLRSTENGTIGYLYNTAPHWNLVLFPTQDHFIRPIGSEEDDTDEDQEAIAEFARRGYGVERGGDKPRHSLRFPDRDGNIIFRMKVHHPGTEGNPLHEKAWAHELPYAEGELRSVARKVSFTLADPSAYRR